MDSIQSATLSTSSAVRPKQEAQPHDPVVWSQAAHAIVLFLPEYEPAVSPQGPDCFCDVELQRALRDRYHSRGPASRPQDDGSNVPHTMYKTPGFTAVGPAGEYTNSPGRRGSTPRGGSVSTLTLPPASCPALTATLLITAPAARGNAHMSAGLRAARCAQPPPNGLLAMDRSLLQPS